MPTFYFKKNIRFIFFVYLIAYIFIVNLVQAADQNAQLKTDISSHHHTLMGSHGMVLMFDEQAGFFISHLPLYHSPHNYQLIYKVNINESATLATLMKNEIVTLLPDNFDLSRLIQGERFSINATFFNGHFERGGSELFTTNLTFEKPILVEKVSASFHSDKAEFYTVNIDESTVIIAHKIQGSPSFDAIGFINSSTSKPKMLENKIICDKPSILDPSQIKQQLAKCAPFQWQYIETQDFKS